MQKIIKEFSKVVKNKVKAAIKFQLRIMILLFIKSVDSENKYVRRFLDTKLSISDFKHFLIM